MEGKTIPAPKPAVVHLRAATGGVTEGPPSGPWFADGPGNGVAWVARVGPFLGLVVDDARDDDLFYELAAEDAMLRPEEYGIDYRLTGGDTGPAGDRGAAVQWVQDNVASPGWRCYQWTQDDLDPEPVALPVAEGDEGAFYAAEIRLNEPPF